MSGGLSVPKRMQISGIAIGVVTNIFNKISSVASGQTVKIVDFTVPTGKLFYLFLVEFSGSNIARYELFINGISQGFKRNYFGGDLNGDLFYNNMKVHADQKIELMVHNFRPSTSDFEGRILGGLADE